MGVRTTLSENSKITIGFAIICFSVAAWAARLDSKVDLHQAEIEDLKKSLPEIRRQAESANTKLDLLIKMQERENK